MPGQPDRAAHPAVSWRTGGEAGDRLPKAARRVERSDIKSTTVRQSSGSARSKSSTRIAGEAIISNFSPLSGACLGARPTACKCGLLPPRHPASQTASKSPRADSAFPDRTTLRHPHARRPLPDHRRTHSHLLALHHPKQNPETPPRPTRPPTAPAIPASHHIGKIPRSPSLNTSRSEDLLTPALY